MHQSILYHSIYVNFKQKKKKKRKDLQTKLDHRNLTFYIILEFNIKFPFNIQLTYLLILLI